jgi:hypothetical protein
LPDAAALEAALPRVEAMRPDVPDPELDSVFVITSYELIGKPLAAYRRRRKKKRQ